jgi:hypothetical protein
VTPATSNSKDDSSNYHYRTGLFRFDIDDITEVWRSSVFIVLPGPEKHSRPHSPKNHGHIRSFYGHLSKNLPLHDISKHNNNKKQKNIIFGEGFCNIFYFCS